MALTWTAFAAVWSDKDKRRIGRKFEIVNIDQGLADCVTVAGGTREKTKIRLDRFKPKYYVLKGTVQGPLSKTAKSKDPAPTPPQKKGGTKLSDACAEVLGGNWGGFGSYALFDNSKVHIIIRLVRTNCYDVKVRLSGHLVYSSVSRADLDTTLGQVRSYLKSLRDNISDVVG